MSMPLCIVVEDHGDTREGYVEFLGMSGMTVLSAANADELRALLANHTPDVIVMDLHLPKVDGWTLIREVKSAEKTRRVPVLVVSAYVRPVDRDDAVAAGCDAFIPKPCDPSDVLAELRRLIAGRGAV
jgi:two-component system cell cycle response regulator DivK